jgi:xylan 1,4-beta-xylosidase
MLLNRGARIFEVDASATRRLSETTLLYYGGCKKAPEGPQMLKKDGYYYLFLAEGGTGMGHRETVARARTLRGPYTPSPYNPLIRQGDEKALLQRCGHGKPVCTQQGEWFIFSLGGRVGPGGYTLRGRETALDRLTWTPDGWPLMNGGRGPSALAPLPGGLAPAPFADEGDPWMTPRAPLDGEAACRDGYIRLRGSDFPLSDIRCRSVMVRRQTPSVSLSAQHGRPRPCRRGARQVSPATTTSVRTSPSALRGAAGGISFALPSRSGRYGGPAPKRSWPFALRTRLR